VKLLRKLIDLILYSSLWIALCAAAQVQLTHDLIGTSQRPDTYTWFVFATTIGLYGLHRLVGINIVRAYEHEGRFAVIKKYRSHIIVYSVLGFIAAAVFFIMLPSATWLYLIIPVAISAAYVIPTTKSGRRLRDLPLVKIFLLASSWSLLTTTVPLLNIGFAEPTTITLIFLERFLFIIAITIPFDIRDMEVDSSTGLRTLPHVLGVSRSKVLAVLLLGLSGVVAGVLLAQGVYPHGILIPYVAFLMITALLIWEARAGRSDDYYSGLLDGTMLLLYLLVFVQQFIVNWI